MLVAIASVVRPYATPITRTSRAASWSSFGDLKLEGIYTGFIPDMSAGVTFGLKLPTGNDNHDMPGILDRDTELATALAELKAQRAMRSAVWRSSVMRLEHRSRIGTQHTEQ